MGLILVFIAVTLLIGFWTWIGFSGKIFELRENYQIALDKEKRKDAVNYSSNHYSIGLDKQGAIRKHVTMVALSIPLVLFALITWAAISASFSNYSEMRAQYDATITQYRGAVTIYSDRADLDIKKAAFTDFVYKGYQENIAGFVKDLRREVLRYNRSLVKKRIWGGNWFYGWFIIVPDSDMKIINILETQKVTTKLELGGILWG